MNLFGFHSLYDETVLSAYNDQKLFSSQNSNNIYLTLRNEASPHSYFSLFKNLDS